MPPVKKIIKFLIAFVFYYSNFFSIYKRFIRGGRVTILMFHRIVDDFHNPSVIVKRKTFEEIIKYIKKKHPIISLDSLVDNIDKLNALPADSYVITFDDGWIEFKDGVYQLLKELDVPATVFLITGCISGNTEFWQERLYRIFRKLCTEKELVSKVQELIEQSKEKELLIDAVSGKNEEEDNELQKLIDLFKDVEYKKINLLLSGIENVLDDCSRELPDKKEDLFLTWEDIRSLKWDGISFCPHTVNHANLPTESQETVNEEIVKSCKTIEDETGRKARHFCYPNGKWNNSIRNIVKESCSSACATSSGFVSRDSDVYALNRIGINEEMVTDWNGNFSKYLFTLSMFIETLR